jgi:hypothetical protein
MLLHRSGDLGQKDTLIASPDGAVSHEQLFRVATAAFWGERRRPLRIPRPICCAWLMTRELIHRLTGAASFERGWMAACIDRQLQVDASGTRQRLGWEPRHRLHILRRMPFLIEHYKTSPGEWYRRNQAAMKSVRRYHNLQIHRLLEVHDAAIHRSVFEHVADPERRETFPTYGTLPPEVHERRLQLILESLRNAVRTGEKGRFMNHCRDVAKTRHEQHYTCVEVCSALEALNQICLHMLRNDPEGVGLDEAFHDHVTMTIQFGIDQIREVYEEAAAQGETAAVARAIPPMMRT